MSAMVRSWRWQQGGRESALQQGGAAGVAAQGMQDAPFECTRPVHSFIQTTVAVSSAWYL